MTGTDGARLLPFSTPKTEPKIIQSVTRNDTRAKPDKQRTKTAGQGTPKTARMPGRKRQAKPPSAPGYHWRKAGAGWDLRKDIYVEENGVRKRKQPYLAHLSREAFREIKKHNRGARLEKAIAQWIAEHDR